VFSCAFHLFSPNELQRTRFEDSAIVRISDIAHSGGCGLFLCATPLNLPMLYTVYLIRNPKLLTS